MQKTRETNKLLSYENQRNRIIGVTIITGDFKSLKKGRCYVNRD
jgi:hypothetical protein